MNIRHRQPRRGFMTADALAGLFLLAALSMALAVAVHSRSKAMDKMRVARHLQVAAERALASAQYGAANAEAEAGISTAIRPTGLRVGDEEWVEVSTTSAGHTVSIVGLVRPQLSGGVK